MRNSRNTTLLQHPTNTRAMGIAGFMMLVPSELMKNSSELHDVFLFVTSDACAAHLRIATNNNENKLISVKENSMCKVSHPHEEQASIFNQIYFFAVGHKLWSCQTEMCILKKPKLVAYSMNNCHAALWEKTQKKWQSEMCGIS